MSQYFPESSFVRVRRDLLFAFPIGYYCKLFAPVGASFLEQSNCAVNTSAMYVSGLTYRPFFPWKYFAYRFHYFSVPFRCFGAQGKNRYNS